jgi:hypothetical protein
MRDVEWQPLNTIIQQSTAKHYDICVSAKAIQRCNCMATQWKLCLQLLQQLLLLCTTHYCDSSVLALLWANTSDCDNRLCYRCCICSKVAKADTAQLGWRGDAADNAVPVFIAERLAFASGAGRVKVSTLTSTHWTWIFNSLNILGFTHTS